MKDIRTISNKVKSFKEVIEEEKEKSRLAKLRIMQKEKDRTSKGQRSYCFEQFGTVQACR